MLHWRLETVEGYCRYNTMVQLGNEIHYFASKNHFAYNRITGKVRTLPQIESEISTAVAYDGKIYATSSAGSEPAREMKIFDPATATWMGASMPDTRSCGLSTVVDGKLYMVNGLRYYTTQNHTEATTKLFCYDFSSGVWSSLAPRQHPRIYGGLAVVGRKLYLFGGISSGGSSGYATKEVEIYDIDTDTWSLGKELPVAAKSCVVGVCGTDIHVAASGTSYVTCPFYIYDTLTDTYRESNVMPMKVSQESGSSMIGNRLFSSFDSMLYSIALDDSDDGGVPTPTWDTREHFLFCQQDEEGKLHFNARPINECACASTP